MWMKKYTFSCPICEKQFCSDEPGEPCCTGPSEMRDDHEMMVMRLVSVGNVFVPPHYAVFRSRNTLIMPDQEEKIQKEIRLLKA